MARPKEALQVNDNNPYVELFGREYIQKIIDGADPATIFLPESVSIRDNEAALVQAFREGVLSVDMPDGKKLPAMLVSGEKWGETIRSFGVSDERMNIQLPVMLIKRGAAPAQGTLLGGRPGSNVYTGEMARYMDVPHYDGTALFMRRYGIPQTTRVDMKYEVSVFTRLQTDLNIVDEHILRVFNRLTVPIHVKNFVPILMLEGTSDESRHVTTEGTLYTRKYTLKYHIQVQDRKLMPVIDGVKRNMVILKNSIT